DRCGFDLIIGNPPWVLVSFDEAGILSEQEPIIAIRDDAKPVEALRDRLLARPAARDAYFNEFVDQTGVKSCLGSLGAYSCLQGMKTNLYKCFICRAWTIGSDNAVVGFLHPEGIYDDPSGGPLRVAAYHRLHDHYQFINEGGLFPEVGNLVKY